MSRDIQHDRRSRRRARQGRRRDGRHPHLAHARRGVCVEASVRETIAIGEQGGLPTQVTHHKTIGKKFWGKTADTLRLVDEARQRGVDVTVDAYPYPASATTISAALMPVWAQEGSRKSVLKRLSVFRRPGAASWSLRPCRSSWKAGVAATRATSWSRDATGIRRWRANGWTTWRAREETWFDRGRRGQCAVARGEWRLRRHLLRHQRRRHPACAAAPGIDGGVGRTGGVVRTGESTSAQLWNVCARARPVHPRSQDGDARGCDSQDVVVSGAAPRLARSRGSSGADEGRRRNLDPEIVRDEATFDEPHKYTQGVSLVVVNGQVAFEDGAMTAARPGRILYGPAHLP